MPMYCDNQTTIFIASNTIFHERTKHIEVDYHFVLEAFMMKQVLTPYTRSKDQSLGIYTNLLNSSHFSSLCSKVNLLDIYIPAQVGEFVILLELLSCFYLISSCKT